jgi:hypothetical protein
MPNALTNNAVSAVHQAPIGGLEVYADAPRPIARGEFQYRLRAIFSGQVTIKKNEYLNIGTVILNDVRRLTADDGGEAIAVASTIVFRDSATSPFEEATTYWSTLHKALVVSFKVKVDVPDGKIVLFSGDLMEIKITCVGNSTAYTTDWFAKPCGWSVTDANPLTDDTF